MFESSSPSKIDRLIVDTFNYTKGNLLAKATFYSSKESHSLGEWPYVGIWPEKVARALENLITAIEEHIGSEVFGVAGERGSRALIDPNDNYETAVIHEHVEYSTGNELDIESSF